mmetsp:Transcript_47992/g.137863  ORF Transcript_47992/g.137863 Transcript_47992/m.137863 type:complete len:200 (+) Transcript_47992:403-1002(+)
MLRSLFCASESMGSVGGAACCGGGGAATAVDAALSTARFALRAPPLTRLRRLALPPPPTPKCSSPSSSSSEPLRASTARGGAAPKMSINSSISSRRRLFGWDEPLGSPSSWSVTFRSVNWKHKVPQVPSAFRHFRASKVTQPSTRRGSRMRMRTRPLGSARQASSWVQHSPCCTPPRRADLASLLSRTIPSSKASQIEP